MSTFAIILALILFGVVVGLNVRLIRWIHYDVSHDDSRRNAVSRGVRVAFARLLLIAGVAVIALAWAGLAFVLNHSRTLHENAFPMFALVMALLNPLFIVMSVFRKE
ncbi:hypothetical protein [Burkholderia vietnamiensis]|uniref:hypothetical protein n=1 Tax=Burkholderia vietnamiensis TaxID=60552 RepID=UPI001CF1C4E7|nr:hypothetical protein [Burkholderia vietnamiensis]MCA8148188.1 hypothetical protein [Burkholderia vietnamiensis]